MAKLCIVLATYNGEKYLSQMLDSLVAQSRKADSIVVVDDGSSDSTVQILERYKGVLPLQITISSQNQGHRAAFSKALEIARQNLDDFDTVALADQDDVWLPQKLELLEKHLHEEGPNGASLVFGDAEMIDSNGQIIQNSWRETAGIQTASHIKTRIAGTNNVTGCLSLFYARLLKDILPIPSGVGVHDSWIALIAHQNGGVKAIDEKVIQYRIHGNNAVGLGNHYSFDETVQKQIEWSKLLDERSTDLHLSSDAAHFAKRHHQFWESRKKKSLLLNYTCWLCANRDFLFPGVNSRSKIKKILFSLLGAPIVHLIYGSSK